MRVAKRRLGPALVVIALAAAWLLHASAPLSRAQTAPRLSAQTAPLSTTRDGVTTVTLADRAVLFEHLPDDEARWAALPSGALVAVADRRNDFDRSWSASLLLEGGNGTELCDRVFHASQPLVTRAGEIVVERGRAGAIVPGRMRVDDLTLDVIDPRGRARTVFHTLGFEAHLVGLSGDDVIIYLVQPEQASLRAVSLSSGVARVIVPSLAPYANDFALAGGAVELSNRDENDRHPVRERIDLASGARTRLWDGAP